MSKNKELVKNTAIISVGKLCTQFLSFLLLPLYTAILSTSEYGTADLLITYQQLIGYVVFFQIEQALFRFLIEVRGKNKECSTIVSSCLAFTVVQALVLGVILGVFGSVTHYAYTGYLYVYVVAVILSGFMLQVARGIGKNKVYALGSFISAISIILFNIIFLVVYRLGVKGMLTSYILGNLLGASSVFLVLKIYKYISPFKINKGIIKICITYSLPLVPNALSWWIISASDRTIVAFFLGTAYNGLLTVAHKFPSAYGAFYTVFNLSWTESAAIHINDDDAEQFFGSVIDKVYRMFSAVAICIIACMPLIFGILINENYADAYYQIPIYMVASLCQIFQGLYSVIYIALKKTKEVAKSTVISATINIILNLLLIKFIGLYAASISTLVSYLVLCVWRYFDLKKYMNVKFDMKLLTSTIMMISLTSAGYYIQSTIICVICITLAIFYSVFINRAVLLLIAKGPRNIKKIITGKNG